MNITATPSRLFSLPLIRTSISIYFFVLGSMFATWASRLPAIKVQLHLSDGELGTVLLGMPIGSILVMPLAGWLTSRFGSRSVVVAASVIYSCVIPCLALIPEAWMLAVALLFAGASGDLINIAANDQAIHLERLYSKSIMSSFHALFSVGGMVGAGLGGLMRQWNIDLFTHFCIVGSFTILISIIFSRFLLTTHTNYDPTTPVFVRPDNTIIGLGIIGLCVMLGEGAMADWSSIYLTNLLPANSGWTTAGYTAFSFAMALGRFGGDWFTNRQGIQKTLIVSGVLSGFGLLLAILVQQPTVVIIGFACAGLGFATVVPLVYSAAGQSKTMNAGMAIAAVSTVSYFGFLFGPPLIGWISEAIGLRWALLLVVFLSFMISVLAKKNTRE
ncbi:MFS transporter [Cytophagaceae bacterium DM2B3-1]|uniref:MFS transporter n=1 Tax=Xanthocytophaga flava TaxID=3048013 RepID=A0ABT7CF54_9BACT|nr:MFS transporter [Xanthocytophaga flavus]MDJ1492340.1 MFS transporter [Xanthocytophaga flavus]